MIDIIYMFITLCCSLSTLQGSLWVRPQKSRVFASRKVEWNSVREEAGGVGKIALCQRRLWI